MTKADVIAALKGRTPVPFEVGGVKLWLRPWTAATRAEFAVWRKSNGGPVGLYSRLAALSVCDESGALLFGEADAADLDGFDSVLMEAVATRVLELNGLGGDDGKN